MANSVPASTGDNHCTAPALAGLPEPAPRADSGAPPCCSPLTSQDLPAQRQRGTATCVALPGSLFSREERQPDSLTLPHLETAYFANTHTYTVLTTPDGPFPGGTARGPPPPAPSWERPSRLWRAPKAHLQQSRMLAASFLSFLVDQFSGHRTVFSLAEYSAYWLEH